MKYDYTVKHNGVWYKAGEEVPSPATSVKKEEPITEVPKEEIAEPKRAYSKTQINRMSSAELNKLASELGIEGGTGQVLKQKIIAHYNL